MNTTKLPPASVLRPELRARLERLEHLEKRERQSRYARWHVPAPAEREPEGWLFTYLDLITLLLVMLVVMLAFSRTGLGQAQAGAKTAVQTASTNAPPEQPAQPEVAQAQELAPAPIVTAATAIPDSASVQITAGSQDDAPAPQVVVAAVPKPDEVEPASGPLPTAMAAMTPDAPAANETLAAPALALVGSIRSSAWVQTATPFSSATMDGSLDSMATGPRLWSAGTSPGPEPLAEPAAATPAEPAPTPAPPKPSLADLGLTELGDGIDVIINEESISFRINNEILFSSGQAALTESGLDVLSRLATVLARNDYRIAVEGHTDPVPIRNDRFPSNWELSTTRATSVLRHLEGQGIPAVRLRATGYADTRPIAPNDSPAGRAVNRRVELIMETRPQAAKAAQSSSASNDASASVSTSGSGSVNSVAALR